MKIRYFIVIISSVLYLASLFQPAFQCVRGSWLGYEVLILGWLGFIAIDPRWLANLAFYYIVYWHITKISSKEINKKYLLLVLLFTFLSGLTALFIFSPIGCPGIDTPTGVKGLDMGGYLWVIALCFISISTIIIDKLFLLNKK